MKLVEQIAIYRDRIATEKMDVLKRQPMPIRGILESLPDDVELVDYTLSETGDYIKEAVFMTDDMRRFEIQFFPPVESSGCWWIGANGVVPKIDISEQAPGFWRDERVLEAIWLQIGRQ